VVGISVGPHLQSVLVRYVGRDDASEGEALDDVVRVRHALLYLRRPAKTHVLSIRLDTRCRGVQQPNLYAL
jgi:hypothetical protein